MLGQSSETEIRIERDFSKNAWAMCLWDALWSIGMPFCMYATVVPTYLLHLDVSKTLIQIVVVGFSVVTLIQLLTNPLMKHPKRKFYIFLTWIFFSLCWFFYGGLSLFFWHSFSSSFWIVFFVCICALISSARHYGTPPLRGIVIENIPLQKRGFLAGMRSFLLGAGGIFGTFLVSQLMRGKDDVSMFHLVFFIGSLIFLVACLPFLFLFKDHAIEDHHNKRADLSFRVNAQIMWKEKNFRHFLLLYCFLFMAQNLAPLLLSYSKDVLNLKAQMVTGFNSVYFISALILGSSLPLLADKFGFRLLAILSSVMLLFSYAIPLFTHAGMYWLFLSYFFYAGSFQLGQLLLGNFGSELLPQSKPTTIIVIGSTLVMPISLLVAPLCGQLVDRFGEGAYFSVFSFASFVSLMTLLGFLFLVKEPRPNTSWQRSSVKQRESYLK